LFILVLAGCPGPTAPATAPVVSAPAAPPALATTLPQPLPRLPDEGPVYASGPWGTREPALAAGDGRAALQAHCSTCHSTTYVTMQPPLPAAAWEATVTKMLKTYGAQVPDEAAKQVLAYLSAHYTPETVEATYAALASSSAAAADDPGARVYRATCAPCHQQDGAGLPGAFPPLALHAPTLLPARRAHLVRLVLWGQQGPIEAAGQRFDGAMPGFAHLSDADLAAALNHVTRAWGNDAKLPAGTAPFTPEEVAAARGEPLAPREVHGKR
jgi:mono/diheme cytochrome c family protein